MTKRMRFQLSFLLAGIVISVTSCIPTIETVTPVVRPSETTPQTSVLPSPEPTTTSQSVVTPISDALPPGLYLLTTPDCMGPLFGPWDNLFCDVRATSIDGNIDVVFARIAYSGIGVARVVNHNKKLAFTIGRMDSHANGLPSLVMMLDLETGHSIEIPTPEGEFCEIEDWSPDGMNLVVMCYGKNHLDSVIGLLAVPTGNLTILLDYEGEVDPTLGYKHPRMSPNGRWLFFIRENMRGGAPNAERLYVMDMSCISEPANCRDAVHLLSLPRPEGEKYSHTTAEWTADGYLAWILYDRIDVYDVESGMKVDGYQTNPDGGRILEMSWSPDGQWIAVTQENVGGTLLIAVHGNERRYLDVKSENLMWISVP